MKTPCLAWANFLFRKPLKQMERAQFPQHIALRWSSFNHPRTVVWVILPLTFLCFFPPWGRHLFRVTTSEALCFSLGFEGEAETYFPRHTTPITLYGHCSWGSMWWDVYGDFVPLRKQDRGYTLAKKHARGWQLQHLEYAAWSLASAEACCAVMLSHNTDAMAIMRRMAGMPPKKKSFALICFRCP